MRAMSFFPFCLRIISYRKLVHEKKEFSLEKALKGESWGRKKKEKEKKEAKYIPAKSREKIDFLFRGRSKPSYGCRKCYVVAE